MKKFVLFFMIVVMLFTQSVVAFAAQTTVIDPEDLDIFIGKTSNNDDYNSADGRVGNLRAASAQCGLVMFITNWASAAKKPGYVYLGDYSMSDFSGITFQYVVDSATPDNYVSLTTDNTGATKIASAHITSAEYVKITSSSSNDGEMEILMKDYSGPVYLYIEPLTARMFVGGVTFEHASGSQTTQKPTAEPNVTPSATAKPTVAPTTQPTTAPATNEATPTEAVTPSDPTQTPEVTPPITARPGYSIVEKGILFDDWTQYGVQWVGTGATVEDYNSDGVVNLRCSYRSWDKDQEYFWLISNWDAGKNPSSLYLGDNYDMSLVTKVTFDYVVSGSTASLDANKVYLTSDAAGENKLAVYDIQERTADLADPIKVTMEILDKTYKGPLYLYIEYNVRMFVANLEITAYTEVSNTTPAPTAAPTQAPTKAPVATENPSAGSDNNKSANEESLPKYVWAIAGGAAVVIACAAVIIFVWKKK